MTPEEVFAGLEGRWQLTRAIEPDIGTAEGEAVFTPAGEGRLHYREDVSLKLATRHEGPAFREYEYVLTDDGIDVFLVDGTLMHSLTLARDSASDVHPCRADSYEGTYRFGPTGFEIEMRVTGPAKDYEIHTSYARSTDRWNVSTPSGS